MSLSLCEVVCMPETSAGRGERLVAVVDSVVTAFCWYVLNDLFLVRQSLWTLKPQEAQKLRLWHDGMAGFGRPASARVCCFSRCQLHRLACIPLPSKIQESRCFPGLLNCHLDCNVGRYGPIQQLVSARVWSHESIIRTRTPFQKPCQEMQLGSSSSAQHLVLRVECSDFTVQTFLYTYPEVAKRLFKFDQEPTFAALYQSEKPVSSTTSMIFRHCPLI
jgi:hypothetical protein